MAKSRYLPLFWRLFLPNAAVLTAACVLLMIQPPNGRVPIVTGGLTVMLALNLLLMRRAFAPLVRLASLMRRVDPLAPGQRLPVTGPQSEVTVLADAFNEMLDRLETERRDSARRALSAQEADRRAVARDLHDEIGQNLTALALQLDRLATGLEDDAAAGEARAARDAALSAVDGARALAARLRPVALDELGLVPALTDLCERLAAQTGQQIDHALERDVELRDPDAELVFYRVAQESLTNVVRHAGASRAWVRLEHAGEDVVLVIEDDGAGRNGAQPGGGIRSMRERALLIGAALDIRPRQGGGTRVELRVGDHR